MINNLYAVRDSGTAAFNPPIMAQNDVMLRRSLKELFEQEQLRPERERHVFVKYASDFDVFLVGTFDTDTGVVTPVSPVVLSFRMSEL